MTVLRNKDEDTSLSLLESIRLEPQNPQAWQAFVDRYEPKIRSWCRRWRLQSSDVDDVLQDVLIRLFASLREFQYDPARSFRRWLRAVTLHAWCDLMAARRRELGLKGTAMTQRTRSIPATQQQAVPHTDEGQEHELLDTALRRVQGRVKPSTWEAFRLTAIEGLTGVEAARRMGIRVAHVFVAKHRVLKMLQEEIRLLEDRSL